MYQIFNLVLLLYVLLVLTPFSGSFFTLNLKKKKHFRSKLIIPEEK